MIEMPEIRQENDRDGIVKGPKEYILNCVKRWMDPLNNGDIYKGLDGWRLDCANLVGKKFWYDFRSLVKKINPDALIVGEILNEKLIPEYL